MRKNKNLLWVVMGFFFVLLLGTQALALLEVNFPEIGPIDVEHIARVQYYWSGDSNTPNELGRLIDPDDGANLDYDDEILAMVKDAPSTMAVYFACFALYPKSEYILLRVWDTKDRDHLYTIIKAWANGVQSANIVSFDEAYKYINETPDPAEITGFDETKLFANTLTSVTFRSFSPPVDDYEVEIAQAQWVITLPDENEETYDVFINPDLPLNERFLKVRSITFSTPEDSLNSGDRYTVKVRHRNYWGDWGDFSESETYTVGAAGGGAFTVDIPLKALPEGLGINTFSNPFSLIDPPIEYIADLVEAINTQGDANVVQTIGWWDSGKQEPVGYIVTYPEAGAVEYEMKNTEVEANAAPFVKGAYQVSVSEGTDFIFELTGTP